MSSAIVSSATVPLSRLRECPDCGLFNCLPPPRAGYNLRCVRCGKCFRQTRYHPMTWTLACTLTGLVFYWIICIAPLLEVSLYGRFRIDDVNSGIGDLAAQGYWPLATLIFCTIILAPLVKLMGFLVVFGFMHMRQPPRWVAPLFRGLKCLNAWTMAEIYLLGFLVAYTRLQAMVHVRLDTAVYAVIGMTLSLVAVDTVMDPEAVWEEMQRRGIAGRVRSESDEEEAATGGMLGCDNCHQANPAHARHCLRCGSKLQFRKPGSVQRSWALMLAAAIFYIPANVLPVMNVTRLGHTESYTILRGAKEFAQAGLWPLAALVFGASILIPALKLLMLGFMLIETERKSGWLICARTKMYRFVDFIGRWSMIDIFMLSILVGLMRFSNIAAISPAEGSTYFAAVVILNMLAILSFDPRLMWDAAPKKAMP